MEWYICFCFSLVVLIASVVSAVTIGKLKHKSRRILSPTGLLFAGIVISSVVLFFPVLFDTFKNSRGAVIETLLLAFHNTIRLFAIDNDFSIITDNIDFLDRWLQTGYSLLGLVLFISAPLITFGFVLSFFKNLSSYKKYLFKFNSDVFVFTKLNERSLALAQSLISNDKKRTAVFADLSEKQNGEDAVLAEKAYELGAICFKKDVSAVNFQRFHNNNKNISFFICGENDSENLEHAMYIISNYKSRKNSELYVLSNSIESELLFSSVDNGCLKVRRVNEIRSLVYRTLYDEGFSIFKNAVETNGGVKQISAVIVGMGSYGTEMLKALSWFCQMDGYKAEINVFDKSDNAESVFASLCPELMDSKHNGNFDVDGEAKYKINIHSKADAKTLEFDKKIISLPQVTYIFVALGSDELNIATSIKLRALFERANIHPRIQAVVYNSEKKQVLDDIGNFKNQKYDIDFIGDMKSSYSEEVIISSDMEEKALARHKKWGQEDDFWRYEYNYKSSVASAIHKKMKIACGIPGAEKNAAERTEEEKLRIRKLEHCRWNAYMRSEGYCYAPSRNDLAKIHTDLVPFDRLPIEKQKMDDD